MFFIQLVLGLINVRQLMFGITQGKLQYVHLSQFPDHKSEFTVQCLISWPHSRWLHKCYHGDYVLLERVYKQRRVLLGSEF